MTATALVMLALMLAVAALSISATVLRTANHYWLRRWVERRLRGGAAGEVRMERPRRMLAAGSLLYAIAVLGAGATIGWTGWPNGGRVTALVAVTLVALAVIADALPRVVGRRYAAQLLPAATRLLRGAEIATTPLHALGRMLLGSVRRSDRETPSARRAAVAATMLAAELDRLATSEERTIVAGVMAFGARQTRDVMTPRAQIFALDVTTPRASMARLVAESAYSRVPIFERSIDRVVGMIHAFDVLRGGTVAAPLRRVRFVDPATPCGTLLFEMLRASDHLAIVRDPHGRTAGLITIEDLLEELVGEIHDEHDEPVHAQPAHALSGAGDWRGTPGRRD